MHSKTFQEVWDAGIAEENKVKEWLRSKGKEVVESSRTENIHQDIDCWIEGVPYSIKAQHKGREYGNIYFELASQLSIAKNCPLTPLGLDRVCNTPLAVNEVLARLVEIGSWEYQWFYRGKALYYLILQGTKLSLYKKEDVVKYVEEKGFRHVRGLSGAVKATQKNYRYCNTICGYLRPNDLPHKVFEIS